MTAAACEAGAGRVALISGASRGIGLAIARELLAHGWRVSAGTRQPVAALAEYGVDRCHWSPFDARDPASEAAWVAAAHGHFGGIDAIVHNAGILSDKSVIEASDQDFDDIFAVNVKSPMRLTRLVWPHLRAAPEGKVLVIASLAGKRVRAAEGGLYSMSKAAALMLAHGIRHAGDPDRIRCTAICPGFVATDMADGVDESIKSQLTQPQEVARIARLALELPATASVAEIPVSWRVETAF
jgi:NAD(P)-dependent dehydrogenase (short-subunit alcohol dehydrogenase family)